MKNFLKETLEVIKANDKTIKDVLWVGNGKFIISWDEFKEIADIEYDSGYGGQEIATDIMVVGKDWWLERHEYDGSEWWEFKTIPQKEKQTIPFKVVKSDSSWCSLEEMNEQQEVKA